MTRKHNPFAPVEPSVLQTPWGDFEVVSANKSRLAEIEDVQKEFERLDGNDDAGLASVIDASMRSTAAGLKDGAVFLEKIRQAWEADEVTQAEIFAASKFVGEELRGGVEEGND